MAMTLHWCQKWGECHPEERSMNWSGPLGSPIITWRDWSGPLGTPIITWTAWGKLINYFVSERKNKDLMKQFCLCVIYSEENHRVKNLVTGHTPTNGCCEKIRSEDCCAYDLSPRANRHVHILGLQKL